MDLVIFEENKPLVLEALRNGEFDYIEAASEVFEADFFRFIKARALAGSVGRDLPHAQEEGGGTFLVLCGQQSFHAASRGTRV